MKIFCIGRNYAEHASELGNEVPDEPVIFMKPDTALLKNNKPFYYPDFSNNIHFECELVLKIGKNAKRIQKGFELDYIKEIGLGIDFTARDIQEKCKEKRISWEIAKAFDSSAVIGEFYDFALFKDGNIHFELYKNEEPVQKGDSDLMIFDFAAIIQHVSKYFSLKMGDLIFTGTPKGVGPVSIGDQLKGILNDREAFSFSIK